MIKLIKHLAGFVLLLLMAGCSILVKVEKQTCKTNAFTKDQIASIMQEDGLVPMRVFKITESSDSILLRTKSEDIVPGLDDPILQKLVKRMQSTLLDSMSLGVGIAAPQVGILKNIILVQRFDKDNVPVEVYLNPKIIQYSKKKQQCREGCLSIPNRTDTLNSRAYAILLEYDKMDKTHKVEMVEDFTAVIFQHEIDHLNGILYLDHLKSEYETKN